MTKLDKLEWFGAITGVIAGLLIALNLPHSKWGYAIYIVSNLALLWFAFKKQLYGILTMQLVYFVISVIGLVRWFS